MARRLLSILLLACCALMLSSCNSIFSLIEEIIYMPFQILQSVIP